MFRLAAFLGLAGLAAATAVIVWSGWGLVLQALEQAGWGIVWVALFHCVPLVVSSAGWRVLVSGKRPSLLQFTYFMWVRAAVNNLMPVARIGGEIACVRLMTASGMRKSTAIAVTVVELTLSIAAVFLFVALGVLLFALRVSDKNFVTQLAWGLAFSAPLLLALAAVQKIGFFGLMSRLFRVMFRDKWATSASDAARLDRAVATVYRRKGKVLICALLQFIAWGLGSVEIWLALKFLGHPLPMAEAVMIEALIEGSASAAFAIPGALGVQEAGFLVFGGMLGLPHETAAALAVIRRCRDLICYAPGLIAWQAHEGKRLMRS
ncbi:MAG: flippase-like domain-containing protein [Alphaproteobacteria bacterium]|nr:flippase-like domain-containing protein [Alphaproteobacteria bacterium]